MSTTYQSALCTGHNVGTFETLEKKKITLLIIIKFLASKSIKNSNGVFFSLIVTRNKKNKKFTIPYSN